MAVVLTAMQEKAWRMGGHNGSKKSGLRFFLKCKSPYIFFGAVPECFSLPEALN